MNDRFCTFIVPLFLLAIFVISIVLYKYFTPSRDPMKTEVPNTMRHPLNNMINAMCICDTGSGWSLSNWIHTPEVFYNKIISWFLTGDYQSASFYNTTLPALGGVDMVQFFTAFKLPDGTYNESEVGQLGSKQYSSSYNNHTYNFISETNLR